MIDHLGQSVSSRARCSECAAALVFSGYDCGDDDEECECDECSYCPSCGALYVFPCDAHSSYYPGRKALAERAF
jgi:hypothetical protein